MLLPLSFGKKFSCSCLWCTFISASHLLLKPLGKLGWLLLAYQAQAVPYGLQALPISAFVAGPGHVALPSRTPQARMPSGQDGLKLGLL